MTENADEPLSVSVLLGELAKHPPHTGTTTIGGHLVHGDGHELECVLERFAGEEAVATEQLKPRFETLKEELISQWGPPRLNDDNIVATDFDDSIVSLGEHLFWRGCSHLAAWRRVRGLWTYMAILAPQEDQPLVLVVGVRRAHRGE